MNFEEYLDELNRYYDLYRNEPILKVKTKLLKICKDLIELMAEEFNQQYEF